MSEQNKQSMLARWAEKIEERITIEDFLEWLEDNGHIPPRFHSGKEQALDKYFEIDRAKLELERKQLLEGSLYEP